MKLVPLADRVVLKQLVAEEPPNPASYYPDRIRKSPSRQKLLLSAPAVS